MVIVTSKPPLSWATQLAVFVWDAYVTCNFHTEQQLDYHPVCGECQQCLRACMLWIHPHMQALWTSTLCYTCSSGVNLSMKKVNSLSLTDILRKLISYNHFHISLGQICGTCLSRRWFYVQHRYCIQIDGWMKVGKGLNLLTSPLSQTTHPPWREDLKHVAMKY